MRNPVPAKKADITVPDLSVSDDALAVKRREGHTTMVSSP